MEPNTPPPVQMLRVTRNVLASFAMASFKINAAMDFRTSPGQL